MADAIVKPSPMMSSWTATGVQAWLPSGRAVAEVHAKVPSNHCPSKTIRRPDGGPTLAPIGRIVQNVDHPIERISIQTSSDSNRAWADRWSDPKIIGDHEMVPLAGFAQRRRPSQPPPTR